MRRVFLTLAFAFCLPAAATATDWLKFGRSGDATTGLKGGEWATYTPASNSDHSPILTVLGCENIDVFHFDDSDGDTTVSTVTWEVELCPASNVDLASGVRDDACEIAAGTAALSGDDVESNLAGSYMRLKGDGSGTDAEAAGGGGGSLIVAKCAQGTGNK